MESAHTYQMKRNLPSDIQQAWVVTKVEFIRNLRRKRLLIFFIIIGLVAALLLAIPPLFTGYPKDPLLGPYQFSQFFTSFVNFLAILLAVFFGGDAIVSEFHNKTGYSILPNPMRRFSLFLGKFTANLFACVIILGVYYIIITASLAVIYSRVPVELLYSFLFAVLYTTACVALAFLISSMMRTTTSATVLTFVLFFFIFNIVSNILMFVGVRTEYILTFQAGVINGFVNGPYPEMFPVDATFHQGDFSLTIYQPTVGMAILVTSMYAVVAFVVGYVIFRRRQMLG